MSTVTTTAAYSGAAGHIGYTGGAMTARFAFTVPGTGATALHFRTGSFELLEPLDNSGYATAGSFRFALSADANAYTGYMGPAGRAVPLYNAGDCLEGSLSQSLLPGGTYYLFLFPDRAGWYDWYIGGLTLSLSGSYAAPSGISAPDGRFGEPLTVTLSRSLNTVTHTVTVTCAGHSETLLQRGETYPSLSWLPDTAVYAPLLPDAGEAQATLTAETFLGDSSLGSRSCQVTLRFRAEDAGPAPQDGWVTLTPENGDSAVTGWIAGRSRALAVFDAARVQTAYGATVQGFSLRWDDALATQAPYRSDVLTESLTLRCAVTDSRGLRAEADFPVALMDYAPPRLSGVSVRRADASGAESEDGSCLAVCASVSCSPLDGQNSAALTVYVRPLGGAYDGGTALVSGQQTLLTGKSPDVGYELRIEAVDTLGGQAVFQQRLPTRRWAMKLRPDGQGVAFGKAPETARALELPEDWSIRFGAESWLDRVWPVGSVYLSTGDASPAVLFGGTWRRIQSRFLLAAGGSYAAGSTGGAATRTLTVNQLPSHSHVLTVGKTTEAEGSGGVYGGYLNTDYSGDGTAELESGAVGGGASFSILPPYLAVYMWRRTLEEPVTDFVTGGYIRTNVAAVALTAPVSSASYAYCLVPCAAGDRFVLSGKGGSSARLWAFTAEDGTRLSVSASSLTALDTILTAPADSAWLVVNAAIANGCDLARLLA